MISNRIRFSGMASGMDTDSIVKDMMRPQQYKIDMQKKEQALVQLRQDAWKDMNKKLYDFHTKFTHKLSLASTYENKITTTSNPNAIDIDNETRVPEGTHNILIKELATSTYVTGKIKTDKLKDKENKDVKLDSTTTVGQLTGSEATKIELKMKVNNKDVTVIVESKDTLNSLAQKMNEKLKSEGFTATYDAANGMFFVNSTKTGEQQTIQFESALEMKRVGTTDVYEATANPSGLFNKLGLVEAGVNKTGKDASYEYNGVSFASKNNQIEINGMQVTLKAANKDEIITISSVVDSNATYAFVKEFVTEYNKLLDEINTKIGTKPAKNIQPLTAEERKAMSDSDIKLWEDKLNSSLFYKDEQLTNFVNSARSILNGAIGGKTLASIGIVTGTWDEKGKLHIEGDEDDALYAGRTNKLKAEIEKDPQAVKDLLLGLGKKLYEDHNKTLTTSSKLKSAMNFYNDKLMADKVKTFDKQILTLEDRMYKMEEMQYRKFAAMEKMLSSLNSQGSWLSQQFGG